MKYLIIETMVNRSLTIGFLLIQLGVGLCLRSAATMSAKVPNNECQIPLMSLFLSLLFLCSSVKTLQILYSNIIKKQANKQKTPLQIVSVLKFSHLQCTVTLLEQCCCGGKVWEGEAVCNLMIKSQFFIGPVSLGCDIHSASKLFPPP